MKKGTLLHADLSGLIARLGHTDQIVIGDAGLPVPAGPARIDLAVSRNMPGFLAVFAAVTSEMQVESAILAQEIVHANPDLHIAVLEQLTRLEKQQGATIALSYISHHAFKERSADSRAVIRSGECSPFANIILCSGVTF